MRGLYLALTTLMIAGGFQVVITAIEFPDGGPASSARWSAASASWMGGPRWRTAMPDYFRYCVAFLVIGYLVVLGTSAPARDAPGR